MKKYDRQPFFQLQYRPFLGTWAWILNRLSGLLLIFYLTMHIWVINTLTKGPEAFDRLMVFLNGPLFKLLEIGLWGVILYHSFNGIRIMIIDFSRGSEKQKKLFWIFTVIAFFLWIVGTYMILSHMGVK